MNKPLFKHDCEHCNYVKTDEDDFGTIADMYVCGESIVFRYSDEPSDNRSVSFQGKDKDFIREAYPYFYLVYREFYNKTKF